MNQSLFVLAICVVGSLCAEPQMSYDLSLYCFRFTWLGLANDNDIISSKNCSALKDIPCVKPIYYSANPPNVTELWTSGNRSDVICNLRPGHVCIKYTFMYNNAVINITRFCGKMTEDTKNAISSGCYSQQIEGHTVEACACVTSSGRLPCNSSQQVAFNNLILFACILITLLFAIL